MSQTKKFDICLKNLLSASLVERGELARYLGVSVPTVSRWVNGLSAPNVYQFREIAHFFGMPYEWFLDDGTDTLDTERMAQRLGLSTDTVELLLDMAETESSDVMSAVDDALCSVIAAIGAVYEDLERTVDDALKQMEGAKKG